MPALYMSVSLNTFKTPQAGEKERVKELGDRKNAAKFFPLGII